MTVTGTEAAADGQGAPDVPGPVNPEEAARNLFQDPPAGVDVLPSTDEKARRAVEKFARLFETAPGVVKDALGGAWTGAETLSGDRLQGLAEIMQNADDAGASYARFQAVGDHFIAVRDGTGFSLSAVLALANPWLSKQALSTMTQAGSVSITGVSSTEDSLVRDLGPIPDETRGGISG